MKIGIVNVAFLLEYSFGCYAFHCYTLFFFNLKDQNSIKDK